MVTMKYKFTLGVTKKQVIIESAGVYKAIKELKKIHPRIRIRHIEIL